MSPDRSATTTTSRPDAEERQPRAPVVAGTPTVLVTDASLGSAVSIIRSLGRRGWRVIAVDSDPRSPGFRSRYVDSRVVIPPAESAPSEMIAALYTAVCQHAVDLVIPVTDAVIMPLCEERSRFEEVCRLAIPNTSALRLAADKEATLATARRIGIPAPRTRLAATVSEAQDAASDLGFPIVLKPKASRVYRDRSAVERYTVAYANSQQELAQRMSRFEGQCEVLLQEYCQGEGCGVELLMTRGRPLAAFQHRRLREVPVTGGASALRESVPLDSQLYDYAVRLMKEIGWTGLAMVEFKRTSDGPRLMEVNGRVWGSLPLAGLSGMDFPGRMAEMFLYGPGPGAVSARYRAGVRSRNLGLELAWIAQAILGRDRYPFLPTPTRFQGACAFLQLFNPRIKIDTFSASDPLPGLADVARILRAARARLGGGE